MRTRTYLTKAEHTDPQYHRSKYILHDGSNWAHADTNDKKQMFDLLNFFECKITSVESVVEGSPLGRLVFYNLSKDIVSCNPYFWTQEQALQMINGRRFKPFIGLSNGSLTNCYAVFNNDSNIVEILRPNPNAKEVYKTMPLDKEISYRRSHWYM